MVEEEGEKAELFRDYYDYLQQLAQISAGESNYFVLARFNYYAALTACDVMREHLSRLSPLISLEENKAFLDKLKELKGRVRIEIVRLEDGTRKAQMQYAPKRIEFNDTLLDEMKDFSDELLRKQHKLKLYIFASKPFDISKARHSAGVGR